ncbi:MAG: bifunctional helix-turn-helix domain-containing protein/methylated-DNA--[protein]-cysteine S-methyltransferase [Pseudomonadota bacterium]
MKHDLHSPANRRYGGVPQPITDVTIERDGDYALVRSAIEYLSENWLDQPGLAELASHLGMGETATQKLFKRWAGLSPKAFLQAVTLDHAKRLLRDDALPLLDATYELGLSSPSRLHDLFVTHEAVPPGIWKAKGEGLQIDYGFHLCPFGQALIMANEGTLIGLAFCDAGEERMALEDMQSRWPRASYTDSKAATAPLAIRIFDPAHWSPDRPLRVTLIGTDFEISVWDTLLSIPLAQARTYSDIADAIDRPKAVRAVGAAVGKNPISFIVPCHRALGKSGKLTGYHWGLTRKQAMLGWEAGIAAEG